MAYTLRDIIKQRTGEIASSGIQPTIYKLKYSDDWIVDYDIVSIGEYSLTSKYMEEYKPNSYKIVNTDGLPMKSIIKQVGTQVKTVVGIRLEKSENNIIPKDLFKYAVNLEQAYFLFYHPEKIEYIPEGLFDNCRKVTSFAYTFSNCDSIKEIPEGLFANCKNVKSFTGTFNNCSSLINAPLNLFDNNKKVITFEECFNSCTNLKSAPHLWEREGKEGYEQDVNYKDCFKHCENLKDEGLLINK